MAITSQPGSFSKEQPQLSNMLAIGLLHLAPRPGDLAHNAKIARHGIAIAAGNGARWVVTPELCLTGYDFAPSLGTDWIQPVEQDFWVWRFREVAVRHAVTLFLAHPERDPETGKLYNSIFVLGPDGSVLGRHRKINTSAQGAERWSSSGETAAVVDVQDYRTGLLLCSDAYAKEPAHDLRAAGAQILLSSANWPPKPHGPDGCWERRSLETGLPLFVCNRTGVDRELDFSRSETIIAHRGERLFAHRSKHAAAVLFEWDRERQQMVHYEVCALDLAD